MRLIVQTVLAWVSFSALSTCSNPQVKTNTVLRWTDLKLPRLPPVMLEVEVHLTALYWVPFFSQLTQTQGTLSSTQYFISILYSHCRCMSPWVRPSSIRLVWIQVPHTTILIHPCCKTSYGFVKILCIKG